MELAFIGPLQCWERLVALVLDLLSFCAAYLCALWVCPENTSRQRRPRRLQKHVPKDPTGHRRRRRMKVRKQQRRKRARSRTQGVRVIAFCCRWAGAARFSAARRRRGLHCLRRRVRGPLAVVTPKGEPRQTQHVRADRHFGEQLGCADFLSSGEGQPGTTPCTTQDPAPNIDEAPGEGENREPDDQLVCAVFERRAGGYRQVSEHTEAPRGGGRTEDDDTFFKDLKAWLMSRGREPQCKGSGNGKGKGGKVGRSNSQQQPASSTASAKDDAVLKAVLRLVERAETRGAQGINDRLRTLVHQADQGKQLSSGRAARKQKAKESGRAARKQKAQDKKKGQQQSFYDSNAWLTENQGSSSYSAGKGKGQQPMEGWHVDRSLQAITAGEARKRLEAQQPLGAASIIVKDSEQATALQNLAKVHEVKDKVAIISQRDLGDGATTRDVTCIKGDRREVREWKAVPLTSAGPSETPTVRLKSSFQPPARDLQTVRIIAARSFMEPAMWANLQGSPRDVVTKLLGSKPIRAEGWKLVSGPSEDQSFVGYLTFEKAVAQKILGSSGRYGLFVEALARDQPVRAVVQWIAPGDMSGVAYLRDVLQQAKGRALAYRKGQGVCLGIRAQRGEALQVAATWRVRGVPKSWSEDDVVEAMTGAGFHTVSVISEASSSRPWLMRGTLEKDTGELALLIEAGLKTLRAERVVGRQRSEAFRERPWKPERATKGKAAGKGKPNVVSAGFPLLMEITDDGEDASEAKDENQSAPDAMAVEGSQAKSTKRPREGDQSRAGKESWEEKECGGQGHCFYNCVTAGFVLKTSPASFEEIQKTLAEKGRGLRARIATYVKEHPAAFKPYFHVNVVDPRAADQQAAQEHIRKVENGEAPTNWQEYLQALFRPQRYADEIAFRAAAALLGVNLCLICGSNLDKPDQVLFYQNPRASVVLYLRHALGHYTLLIPRSEQLPDYVMAGAEVASPQAFAPRGGGESEAVDDSWLPPRGCSPSPIPEPEPQVTPVKQEHTSSPGVVSRGCVEALQASRAVVIKREPSPRNIVAMPLRRLRRKVKLEPIRECGAQRPTGATAVRHKRGKVKSEPKLSPAVSFRRLRGKTSLAAPPVKLEVSGEGATDPQVHWSTLGAKKRSQQFVTSHNRFAWMCDVCKMRVSAGEWANLRFARSNHISRLHKGEDKRRFSKLGPEPRLPIPLQFDCSDPTWMCWHCGYFLTKCQRRVRANSIEAHIRQCELCPLGWTPLLNLKAILEDHGFVTLGKHQGALAQMFHRVDLRAYRPASRASVKQEPGKGYIHDVTDDGDVEPNPGPSCSYDVLSWNAQGFNQVVQALQLGWFSDFDVAVIQEPNLSRGLYVELAGMCERRGFHLYARLAEEGTDSIGRRVARGGLATLVRHGLPSHRVGDQAREGDFERLTIRVGTCLVHNVHRKPSGPPEPYQDTVAEWIDDSGPSIAVGDHNVDYCDWHCPHGSKHAALADDGRPLPTRVDGNRCIDYVLGSGAEVNDLALRDGTLGDHFMLTCRVQVHNPGREVLCRARPTTCYLPPTGTSGKSWTEAQAALWQDVQIPEEGELTTEEEWRWFNDRAESAMRAATLACGVRVNDPPQRRAKGSLYDVQVQAAGARGAQENLTFQLRGLLKLQGRLREWQRQSNSGRDTRAIQANIVRTWPRKLGDFHVCSLEEALAKVAQAIGDAQHARTRQAVCRWQQDLAARGKRASRWLQGKGRIITKVAPHDAPDDAPPTSLSINTSLDNLRVFWGTIWDRPGIDYDAAVWRWKQSGQNSRFVGRASALWAPEALHAAATAKPTGAAGPDGWSGAEISTWPLQAWICYSALLDRWMRQGIFPRAWRQLRQVHLPKEGGDDSGRIVKADGLRPIAIMSILWRVVSSAAATHESMQSWVDQVVEPGQFGGIRARHLHQGLGKLSGAFQRGAALTSLDLAKCFDYVHPALATRILAEAGFPRILLAAMSHAWTQERFMELGGYVLRSPQNVDSAMPQGDGLSPLALNVLLSAACREARRLGLHDFEQSIFLDDRAFTSAPGDVPRLLAHWESWSNVLGLKENRRKQAIVARSASCRHRLRDLGLGHLLQDSVRVLGVDLTASPSGACPTADARVKAALTMGRKLLNRAIPVTIRRDLWRTRVIAKVSWGHLFQPPAKETVAQFTALFKQVVYSHRMGHAGLRQILEGHAMHMPFMAGLHALRAWRSSGAAQQLAAQSGEGTWFGTVASFLTGHGWHHEGGSVFSTATRRLDCDADPPKHMEHKVRAQWRQQLHETFLQADRRDSRALGHWAFSEAQVRKAIPLYQDAGSDCKSVMLGAAHSTAFYQKRKYGHVAPSCPWCTQAVAPDWEHLVWHCTGLVGVENRPPRPLAAEASRLGWPMPGESDSQAAARLRWMGCVREQVREHLGAED